ncbi:MAG TPA: HD domain-containing protein [Methanotrichaceae archaeon]|nr:HD domain-containing protein [Methanotrichaceae archaeon]
MDYFEAARELAKGLMSGERQLAAHRLDHIERVPLNASEIAARYPQADMEELRLAALLHDVDQPYDRKEEHVELITRDAVKLLHEVGCPSQKADRVLKI